MYGLGCFYTTAELNGYDGYHMASQSKIFTVRLFTEKVLLTPGLKQKVVKRRRQYVVHIKGPQAEKISTDLGKPCTLWEYGINDQG